MDDVRSSTATLQKNLGGHESTDPLTQRTSVELATWEWRLVRQVLQTTRERMQREDVEARIMGDRLYAIEDRITDQVTATDE